MGILSKSRWWELLLLQNHLYYDDCCHVREKARDSSVALRLEDVGGATAADSTESILLLKLQTSLSPLSRHPHRSR